MTRKSQWDGVEWRTPPGHSDHWSFIRFGRFGLFVLVANGRAEARVNIYRRDDSTDDDWYSGPDKDIAAKSKAGARKRALAWARSIGLAVPE